MSGQGKVTDEKKEMFNTLRNEHAIIGSSWRFLVGLRFAILAFSITLLSIDNATSLTDIKTITKKALNDMKYLGEAISEIS